MLPSQAASNSSLEEFPADSHQEDGDEQSSEVLSTTATKTSGSTNRTPVERDEEAAAPLKTKPLPKVNALAREIRVKVTGARAGNVSEERDLFAENTTTVLVFERGGVIRLAAAVSPGQLLFLTNEESKREVVTQVLRKRIYRPTECYVELEFTETAPGFWGTEFSAATALLPKDGKEEAAAELIASAETTEDELDGAGAPPSAAEVEALKKEVEALRSRLNLLQPPAEAGVSSAAPAPNAPAAPSSAASPRPPAEEPSTPVEYAQTASLISQALPLDADIGTAWVPPAKQKPATKPTLVFRKSLPPRKRSFRARGEFTPGFRSGILRLAILSSILAALIGTAWYQGWLPGISQPKKIAVSSAGGVTTPASRPVPLAAMQTPAPNAPTLLNGTSIEGTSSGAGLLGDTPVKAAGGGEKGVNSSASIAVMEKPAAKERNIPPASLVKTAPTGSLGTKTANSVQALGANSIDVPPKLIKSQRATASLDDLRDFETGSVVIDAIIDTGGNVTSMKVLAGPPSLRWPALQALKNYKYQPAMQNGRPVPAHVTVKIQFHFEE